MKDVIVIGAGLTGLTLGYRLVKGGADVLLVEKSDRIGGQIQTHEEGGFVFESGPNTGVVSSSEVARLFMDLKDKCRMVTARESSKRRLIYKNGSLKALPSSLWGGVTTPLFTFTDKIRLLGEPFRKRGDNPDESVAELVLRRMGRSFLDFAVDPFIGGIYAGDPRKLVTRHALPKLYNLEQTYGSFIKGAVAKAKLPKTEDDKLVTKKIYSVEGGLEKMCVAMGQEIGADRIILSAGNSVVSPCDGGWVVITDKGEFRARYVVTTVGGHALPELLPHVEENVMKPIKSLDYAPVVQVSVGLNDCHDDRFESFGALMPSSQEHGCLGILFPSGCFDGRTPEGASLMSVFMGGVKHREVIDKSDEEIVSMVSKELKEVFGIDRKPDLLKIWRHRYAIPQYDGSTDARLDAVEKIQAANKGLILAGNIRDGIGMPDRIKQASRIAEELLHAL